jgi:hypothetical protein
MKIFAGLNTLSGQGEFFEFVLRLVGPHRFESYQLASLSGHGV